MGGHCSPSLYSYAIFSKILEVLKSILLKFMKKEKLILRGKASW